MFQLNTHSIFYLHNGNICSLSFKCQFLFCISIVVVVIVAFSKSAHLLHWQCLYIIHKVISKPHLHPAAQEQPKCGTQANAHTHTHTRTLKKHVLIYTHTPTTGVGDICCKQLLPAMRDWFSQNVLAANKWASNRAARSKGGDANDDRDEYDYDEAKRHNIG